MTAAINDTKKYMPMLLMNSKLQKGSISEFIHTLKDPEARDMALAEYYYFTGKHKESTDITSKYLDSKDTGLKVSAWLMYIFCNLTLCRPKETQRGISYIREILESDIISRTEAETEAMYVMVANAANILIHLEIEGVPDIKNHVKYLPPGFRVMSCYMMAHQAYLKGEYNKGLGIVETCLSLEGESYLIPTIYLYLSGAMNAMSVDNVELGKEYFTKAFELAKPDGLIEPIGEHHGLLQGLIEICLKKSDEESYRNIIAITYRFSYGWRRVHNPQTHENVADTLTTTEFTIAMLASRGWTNNKIADYMKININTVKTHLTNVFNKLNIGNRKDLKQYMLK